jgi:hypothetical protein
MRTPANNRGYFQAEIIAKVTTPKKKTHNSTKQKTLNMITFKQAYVAMLPVSLDCTFSVAPFGYSLTFIY